MDEQEIRRLLRLKRFETPGADYFERFAEDFRRRQRADLLRQPVWRLALDRIGAFFDAPSASRPAYALASVAVVAAAALYSFSFLNRPLAPLADASAQPGAGRSLPELPLVASSEGQPVFSDLGAGAPDISIMSNPAARAAVRHAGGQPHYVIDIRPASYDPSNSF